MLVDSLLGQTDPDLVSHRAQVRQSSIDLKAARARAEGAAVKSIMASEGKRVVNRLKRAKDAGGWLTLIPNLLNGSVLTAEEYRDNIRLRCGIPLVAKSQNLDSKKIGLWRF